MILTALRTASSVSALSAVSKPSLVEAARHQYLVAPFLKFVSHLQEKERNCDIYNDVIWLEEKHGLEGIVSYIKTRPPVEEAEIKDLIDKLATVRTKTIDGVVLSNIVRACYECGLKSGELIDLSIGDVSKGGKINDSMLIDGTSVPLTSQARKVLQDHLDHLRANGYKMYSRNPLFPTKKGGRYYQKLLDGHLKKGAVARLDIILDKIRQAGICRYYDQMRDEGFSAQECLEKAHEFAHNKRYRTTKNILKGQSQQTGVKVSPIAKYAEEIDKAVLPSNEKPGNPGSRSLDEIRDAFLRDKRLGVKEKATLNDYIDSTRDKKKNDDQRPEEIRDDKKNTSLVDKIKQYRGEPVQYSVDDIVDYFGLGEDDSPEK